MFMAEIIRIFSLMLKFAAVSIVALVFMNLAMRTANADAGIPITSDTKEVQGSRRLGKIRIHCLLAEDGMTVPCQRVEVLVSAENLESKKISTSGENFEIPGLYPRKYEIRITHLGCKSSQSIKNVEIGKTYKVEFKKPCKE